MISSFLCLDMMRDKRAIKYLKFYNNLVLCHLQMQLIPLIIKKQLAIEMRANQNEDGQQAGNYLEQNRVLRELYEQRMKQRELANKEYFQKSEQMIPQKKAEDRIREKQKKQEKEVKISYNLFLNTLYFDSQEKKPQFFIKIFSLLNEDVTKPKKTVSENIQTIFITTFGFETDTFQHLLRTSNVKLVVLNDSDEKGENKIFKQYGGFKNFTVILKSKKNTQGYGVFHTKLWLIKFKTFLRVVVCTSNQHTMDWAVWQNAFWYQDFPIKSINSKKQEEEMQKQGFNFNRDFQDTLTEVVDAMLTEKQLYALTSIKLKDYSFQNVKVVLIPSIPGRHVGETIKKQGIGKIKQVMKIFNNIKDPIMTYNSTSLGIVQKKFIDQLFIAFCPKKQWNINQKFRLIYPTKKYIEQQTGGQASVLFLTQENYRKSDMGKKVFHKFDTNPENPILGCIPHLKTILIQQNQEKAETGILYIGSHNMTKAAWGKYEKNGAQLFISNSQLGLLFPDVQLNWFKKWTPFQHPPQPYGNNDEPYLRVFAK